MVAVSTRRNIAGTNQKPNYFPAKLYETAATTAETAEEGGGVLEFELNVDAKLDYLVWLHFAEIEDRVRKAGERVFDVFINGDNLTRVDIYKQVGGLAAFTWHHTVKNLSSSSLIVKLVGVVGAPIICGIENYALVPGDPSTVPQQGVCSLLNDYIWKGIVVYFFYIFYANLETLLLKIILDFLFLLLVT